MNSFWHEDEIVILNKMGTTGDNYMKQIKSVSEGQMLHDFSHLWVPDLIDT